MIKVPVRDFFEMTLQSSEHRQKNGGFTIPAIDIFRAIKMGFTTSNGVHNGSFPEFC
jgi:hypothetical protein